MSDDPSLTPETHWVARLHRRSVFQAGGKQDGKTRRSVLNDVRVRKHPLIVGREKMLPCSLVESARRV